MASLQLSMESVTEKVAELKDEQSSIKNRLATLEKRICGATALVIAIAGYIGIKAIGLGS